MTTQSDGCLLCKTKFNGFETLEKQQLSSLKESHCKIEFNKGETILKQGTTSNHLICLKTGYAKMHLEGVDGKSIIIKILKEGDFIVSTGIFNDNLNHFTVTAISNCEICLISSQAFEKTFGYNNEFAKMIMKQNHQYLNVLHQLLANTTFKKMNGRVADTMIYLSEVIYMSTQFYTTLTRQDLADMSGVSKESFIRIMKDFKDSGILDVTGNQFNIKSMAHLHHISKAG